MCSVERHVLQLSGSRRSVWNSTAPYPPAGDNIPMSVTPSHIDDSVTMEEEDEWSVRRLHGQRSGGTSCMRAEHLREWLWEHQVEEATAEDLGNE